MLTTLPSTTQRTTVDFGKIAYVNFFYKNQWGEERELLPLGPTANGQLFIPNEIAPYVCGYELETMGDRAKRLGVIDRWISVLVVTLCNGHRLRYTGNKAVNMNKKWRKRVYGRQEGN